MPFGLDIKSIIVGILLAYFVIPYITALINRPGAARASA
jgi:antibiotic biosynthesis monooxygenase (ABM) superfamily enzyme